ncbi:hypothetical protein H072_4634 [Dactylellina haptotyla CBS 200.50]|uniref:DNA repair protein rad9 n=1 Tax=Dactylellina haptotyla (strain CBS 200.50) TaxID=1284197 RepID=S8BPV4_DACHA|nr:hypothetical protein H072_4634 [Dactylellina haptotyla CBS 200.50]
MATLNITLNPVAVDRLYEALNCLAKFGDYVTLEAKRNKLNLRTLNQTHSAHILICLAGDTFCDAYNFVPDPNKLLSSLSFGNNGSQSSSARPAEEGAFTCQMNVRALLPVFRGRYVPEAVNKERDDTLVQGIEKCEISLHEKSDKVQCRLVVKLFCRHGVMKTFRLQYEEADIISASFRREWAINRWTIRAGELKKWMEHFGPKTEHLQISHQERTVNLTSYTEKIIDGAQILKTPLQTSVELDLIEFNEFQVASETQIAVTVKDFKSIVTHAGTFGQIQIQAAYGEAGQPMQMTYDQSGMFCEFTLMTRKRGAAGPAGAGKAEPVAKILAHRNAPSAPGSVGTRTRETSAVPIKTQPGSAGPASRKSSVTPGPSVSSMPPPPSVPPTASRAMEKLASVSREMPPPPSRITPRVGSTSMASNSMSRDSPSISGRQPSSLSFGLRGSLPPRPSQSLFLMDDDEDDLFGPTPGGAEDPIERLLDDDDDEDVLGWDASLGLDHTSSAEMQEKSVHKESAAPVKKGQEDREEESGSFVDATQRKNVVKGLFD